jgi:hypothetical protein
MNLAIALLSRKSLGFELYAASLDGHSVHDLAVEYRMPVYQVQEQINAVRLALAHQVHVAVNRASGFFAKPSHAIHRNSR